MNTSAQAFGYVHRYLPPSGGDPRTLLLLHGTGGDENDLIPLGQMLAPDAGLLSPRGTVNENGAARFFKRLAEGVFDIDDLHARTKDLVVFIQGAAGQYKFDPSQVVAVGFSNGANIAGSVLLSSPSTLNSAGSSGRWCRSFRSRRHRSKGIGYSSVRGDGHDRLAAASRTVGRNAPRARADVTLNWQPTGHALSRADVSAAYNWLNPAKDAE
jgi:phospholipase/carboxylesterase/glyoxalase family protein